MSNWMAQGYCLFKVIQNFLYTKSKGTYLLCVSVFWFGNLLVRVVHCCVMGL